MADVISSSFSPIAESIKSGGSGLGLSGWLIGAGVFIGIGLIAVILAVIWFFWWEKRQWTITTRVHYENPAIDGVTIGSPIKTKRVRFKDGRVVYIYQNPIQGYTISPELLVWTRPREHDIIVTQDKKLFCLMGISSIDSKRKLLNVDISYPDIEMDRQDLQNFIDSKKFDDPNEKLKLITKAAIWIFVIIAIIILLVLGGKYYIDGKKLDVERDKINVDVAAKQAETAKTLQTIATLMQQRGLL